MTESDQQEDYRVIVERELQQRCPFAGQYELTVEIPPGATYVAVSVLHEGEAIELGKFPDRWLRYFSRDREAREKVYDEVAAVCTALAWRSAAEAE